MAQAFEHLLEEGEVWLNESIICERLHAAQLIHRDITSRGYWMADSFREEDYIFFVYKPAPNLLVKQDATITLQLKWLARTFMKCEVAYRYPGTSWSVFAHPDTDRNLKLCQEVHPGAEVKSRPYLL